MKERIPLEFVRAYLKCKGRKMLHSVWCECDIEFISFPEHPIKFLWEHVKKGHEPSFDCCWCWDRQVGRDTGEFEYWYKWWTWTWNSKYDVWELVTCYKGEEGFEEDCIGELLRQKRELEELEAQRRLNERRI